MKPPRLHADWTNLVYFNPTSTRFQIESFWIKANDPTSRRAVWLRFTLFSNAKEQYGEMWSIYFDAERGERLATREAFPLNRVRFDPERAGIGIGECSLESDRSTGVIRDPAFTIAWDLRLEDAAPPYTQYPLMLLYRNPLFPKKKLTSPHPDATMSGVLEIWRRNAGNDALETIDLAGWRGMQGHVWGKHHIERYVWMHCNMFDGIDSGAWLDVGSGQVRVGPWLLPHLTVGKLVLDGKTYRFDTVRHLRAHDIDYRPAHFAFTLRGPDGELRGKVHSKKDETVGLTYTNPNGKTAYCINSAIAHLDMELLPRDGAPRAMSSARAMLEVTQLDANHGIPLML
ncbi:MAG: hypothetical protein V3T05_13540 [Myxococcota bacterium]